ncbi:GNAT family N-acetyltransferase [Spirosoma oryzicola]|uniref:GNAT family N-acetyltransferase n=1 Tax=Spirosoma oryzicola TaxID=2898794 RepID=UPI001E53AAD8|nr:GNAT family N-acetyltransferase [Spirosoma oryzicola]UHG92486.1 GNAT family N-acetyltransferase [Spirosoma oryzicola]
MIDYTILHQFSPEASSVPLFSQPGFFFNEIEHLRQQQNGAFHLLTVLNQQTQQAEARCAFFVSDQVAMSPGAAPFGSVEFSNTLPDDLIEEFIGCIQDTARTNGARALRLVNYPHCYAPTQAEQLTRILEKHEFALLENHQNFFLPVTETAFESKLVASERRRLRKCREAHFRFTQGSLPDVKEVAAFLQDSRHKQGYRLTLGTNYLITLLQNFPHQFPVFTVRHREKLIALTVAVRVRHDILYSFLPASHPDYRTFSPMVLLLDCVFTYCQQQGIRVLDLGVSLDADRQPKLSLIRFKQNLGAQSSPKLTFEKKL